MVPSQDDPTAQMKEEFPFLHALSGGGVDLSGEPPSLGEGPGGERETLAVDIVNISDMKPIGNPNGSVPSPTSEPAAGPETTCQSRDDVIKSLLDALPPSMSQRHTETALNATCQVEDCNARLCHLKEYHQRYRVCIKHLKCDYIVKNDVKMRFCQQCGKFQDLVEFDEGKRSCRERLKKHNERRRKRLDARYAAAMVVQMAEERSMNGIVDGVDGVNGVNGATNDEVAAAGYWTGGESTMGGQAINGMNHALKSPSAALGIGAKPVGGVGAWPHGSVAGNSINVNVNERSHAAVRTNDNGSLNNTVEIISDLVSYMMHVRSLSSTTTALEQDVGSRTCADMLNMALDMNFVPKQMPSPRVMALLLHNFAGAMKYDISNMVLTPLPSSSVHDRVSDQGYQGMPGMHGMTGMPDMHVMNRTGSALTDRVAKRARQGAGDREMGPGTTLRPMGSVETETADLLNYLKTNAR